MATITPQRPILAPGVSVTFQAVTAADKFQSNGGGTWVIVYKNGATAGTVSPYVVDQNVAVPPGATVPATPTGAVNWSDLAVGIIAANETGKFVVIPAANIAQYTDSTQFVNLNHTGTITTITVAVLGPF